MNMYIRTKSSRPKLLIFFFALLAFTVVKGQNVEIDSLERVLQKQKSTNRDKVDLLNKLVYELSRMDPKRAGAYAEQATEMADQLNYAKGKAASLWSTGLAAEASNQEKALDCYQQALRLAKECNDNEGIFNYELSIGNIAKALGDIEKSDQSYRQCLQIARQQKDDTQIIKASINLAQNYSHRAMYEEALLLLQEAIDLSKKTENNKLLSSAYSEIGFIYTNQGNYPVALEYYLSGLKIDEQIGRKAWAFRKLINIAGIQSTQKDFDLALGTLQKAFQQAKSTGDSLGMSVCLSNIGSIHLSMNNPSALSYFEEALSIIKDNKADLRVNILTNIGDIYTTQKKFDQARIHLEEALTLADGQKLKRSSGSVWLKIGLLYSRQNQYSQAKRYTEKALRLAQEINQVELQRDCHKLLAEIDASTGDFRAAYQDHILYKSLTDSLFSEESIRQTAILQNTYTYQKEKQKYESDKVAQGTEIKEQKLIIFFLVIISVIVLILLFFIYRSNKLKKKLLKVEIESMSDELDKSQKATTTATLKLLQSAETEAHSIGVLENLNKDKIEEDGQSAIRSLITEYKIKSSSPNWSEFEILFEKIHPSFYETLNKRFPALTPNERKLCVFLKLNMSNNHISQITLQSEEALKKARLRLRKKLNIDRDVNLAIFIQNL